MFLHPNNCCGQITTTPYHHSHFNTSSPPSSLPCPPSQTPLPSHLTSSLPLPPPPQTPPSSLPCPPAQTPLPSHLTSLFSTPSPLLKHLSLLTSPPSSLPPPPAQTPLPSHLTSLFSTPSLCSNISPFSPHLPLLYPLPPAQKPLPPHLRQVDFLCDEAGKGTNTIVSQVLESTARSQKVFLHPNNCCGQNKNNCML